MAYCENFKGILRAYDDTTKTRLLSVARCKQWSCEYCAVKNKQIWRARILEYIANNKDRDYSWFTLTAHENTHKRWDRQKATHYNLIHGFSKIMKRIRRKFGNDVFYVRIFETHKSGALHLHCILSIHFTDIVTRNKGKKSQYTDSNWLRKSARLCGVGYMTHASNIESEKWFSVAGYITKYMTKHNIGIDTMPRNIRRIQSSRHIRFTTDKSAAKHKWSINTGYWIDEYIDDVKNGITPIFINEKREVNSDDYLDSNVLPK